VTLYSKHEYPIHTVITLFNT